MKDACSSATRQADHRTNYTDEQITAVTGFPVAATIHNPSRVRAARFSATEACPEELAKELRYDASEESEGRPLRSCGITARTSTDAIRRLASRGVRWTTPGIRYGLGALNAGKITVAQFLDINEKIGGFDIDGNMVPERMVADPIAIRAAYRTGRLNQAQGGLGDLPVIDYRSYYDDLPGGDVHMRFQTFTTDARLMKAERHDGQPRHAHAGPAVRRLPADESAVARGARPDGSVADGAVEGHVERFGDREDSPREAGRPGRCLLDEGRSQKIVEKQQFMAGRCHELYPSHTFPRFVAGAPIANDIIKCQLKPISASDYEGDALARTTWRG